jgi:peptide/nickel transport system permease protein
MMTGWDINIYFDEMERLGLNEPIYVQFAYYLRDFFTGNWGESYSGPFQGWSVNDIITTVLPRTLELMIIPIIITPIIAVKLGTTSAKNRMKRKDILIRSVAVVGAGFPSFWIAILLQFLFGRILYEATFFEFDIEIYNSNSVILNPSFPDMIPTPSNIFFVVFFLFLMIGGFYLIYRGNKLRKREEPSTRNYLLLFISGILICFIAIVPIMNHINTYGTKFRLLDSIIFNDPIYFWDTIAHLLLPSISMTFLSLAGITRLTRSSMLEVLDQDYIRTARAKGVPEKEIINKHALRNALIPTSNLIIGGVASALLGSLFIELIYGYSGFGNTFFFAIMNEIFH